MSLLFDEDYQILKDSGLTWEEDEERRYLIITNYPLKKDLYGEPGKALSAVEVLIVIPPNYNMSGGDMFWTNPCLTRLDNKVIPATGTVTNPVDPRFFKEKQYYRWSRHWKEGSWKEKEDNVLKILSRIEWALKNPDANS